LVEFYTGVALFQTHDNLDHLAMMEIVMGRMPERFSRQGARSKPEYFKEGPRLDWPKPKASRQTKKDVRACRPLAVSYRSYSSFHVLTCLQQEIMVPTDMINKHFLDLVRKLLTFDPTQRITVREALSHPYFHLSVPDES
jgi:dual-specificity kinase